MKLSPYLKFLLALMLVLWSVSSAHSQTETLSNLEIIEMTKVGVSKEIILQKLKTSVGNYDLSVNALIELKKAAVDDEIVAWLMANGSNRRERISTETTPNPPAETENPATFSESQPRNLGFNPDKNLTPIQALRSAKTVGLKKSSLHPARQSLEKELLKRPTWRKLTLSITEDKENADLILDIGFVPLSLISHRYTFRLYDNRSGIVIAAGETTSWGDLATNLAKKIVKKIEEAEASEPPQK